MNAKLYKIKCLTNLHVGNGDVNFNIIDCEVERDPVTNYPTINASGIKGAFREHFEAISSNDVIDEIFGIGNSKSTSNEKCGGKVKFFCANMLAIPMRVSKGDKPYALVTTETAINQLKTLCSAVCPHDISTACECDSIEIEGVKCSKSVNIFGEELYVMEDAAFSSIPLPVLARNCLETGKENLWYEEIVPHEATFYFFAISADNTLDKFDERLKSNNIVQFGGNASIGYGMCKVEEV